MENGGKKIINDDDRERRCDGKKTKEYYIETCARMIKLQSQKRRYTHTHTPTHKITFEDLPCRRYLKRVVGEWRVWGSLMYL